MDCICKNGLYTKLRSFLSSKPGKIITAFLSLIPALLTVIIVLYYIWGPAEGYFHSDCTDNLLWANASLESGEVFDEQFRYAGLLPFSSTMWMIPLVKIFGVSMTAQNLGMSIFAVLFIASIYFFCRTSGFGIFWSSSTAAVTTLFLSSSDKLREIMYGHTIYYSMAPLILFLLGGFFLLARKAFEKKTLSAIIKGVVFELVIIFLCAGTATDGGQVIVIGSLPIIAGVIAERFFCGEDKLFSKKNTIAFALVIAAGIGTLVGIKLLSAWKGDNIDCGYANAYSGWSDISTWVSNAQNFTKHYFSLIGASSGKDSLFSKDSIGTIIRIGCGVIILAVPVVMFCFYKKIRTPGVKIAMWAHLVVTGAVMFGFICGKLSGVNWRLTPIVATAAAVTVMGARELCVNGLKLLKSKAAVKGQEPDNEVPQCNTPDGISESTAENEEICACGRVKIRFGAAILAVLMLFSVMIFKEIKAMPADYGRDNYRHALADFLVDKDLEYGYATFWYSQSITAISDSETKCREILVNASRGVYTDYYQSSRRWYTGNEYENYYVLLSDSEYTTVANSASWNEWISKYFVASYDSADGLLEGFHVFVFSENVLALTISVQ